MSRELPWIRGYDKTYQKSLPALSILEKCVIIPKVN